MWLKKEYRIYIDRFLYEIPILSKGLCIEIVSFVAIYPSQTVWFFPNKICQIFRIWYIFIRKEVIVTADTIRYCDIIAWAAPLRRGYFYQSGICPVSTNLVSREKKGVFQIGLANYLTKNSTMIKYHNFIHCVFDNKNISNFRWILESPIYNVPWTKLESIQGVAIENSY